MDENWNQLEEQIEAKNKIEKQHKLEKKKQEKQNYWAIAI